MREREREKIASVFGKMDSTQEVGERALTPHKMSKRVEE